MDNASLDRLLAEFSGDLEARDIWASFHSAEPHDLFCDQFALQVARRYAAGDLAYMSADRAMNGLYHYCYHLGVDRGMPDFAWLVFEIFEEGEYIHDGDSPNTASDEKYVRPAIQRLLGLAR